MILVFLKACIRVDNPEKITTSKQNTAQTPECALPKAELFKNITIDGVDYRQSQTNVGKYGGEINTSSVGEGPKTFNPWNSKDATSSMFGDLLFDGLISTDAYTGKEVPLLAKSFEISPDGKVYTIHLRHGVKWSDGQPITADDVTYTWNTIIAKGYGNTSARDNVLIEGKMPEVTKVDDYTVKFILPKPFAPFLRQLSVSIAPKHIVKPITDKGTAAFASFWSSNTPPEQFVTSGKFRLKLYIPAQRVELVRNKNYYEIDQKGQKLPYLDKYVVYIVGDLNNEVLKFEAKEIDILSLQGNNIARMKELEKKSDFTLYNLGPDTGTTFVVFNMNNRKDKKGKYYVEPKKQKWFDDINFRSAVDYAIDRESLVYNILNGAGAPLFTAEALPSIYLNQKLKNGHNQDVKKAKEFLKKSGFYWDKKGQLHDKAGNLVEFTLLTNAGNTEREATGVMVKQDLEDLGMKVNFKPLEFNVLVGKVVDTLDWDMVLIGLTGSALEPHGGRNVWASNGGLHMFNQRKPDDSTHDIYPWEKQLDNLFEQGASVVGFDKRKAYYDKYQEIVYNEKPLIYLYSPLRVYAVRNKFENLCPTRLGGVTHNIEELYIKDAK